MAATKITICDAKLPGKVLMVNFKFNRDIIDAIKALDLNQPRNIRYSGDWTVKLTMENLARVKEFIRDFNVTICEPDRAIIQQWMRYTENSERLS